MALHHFQETFGKNVGAAGDVFVLAGAEVTVKDEATGTLVAIYQDVDGNTIKANPFNADGNGFAEFYVKSGRIRVTATANGQTVDLRNISLGSSIPVTTGSGADQDLGAALDQRVISVDTLADLQALPTGGLVDGQSSSVNSSGASMAWRVGDKSAEVNANEVVAGEGDGGAYLAPSSDKTGASGAWENISEVLLAEHWGYKDDNATDNGPIIKAISSWLRFKNGGDIVFGGTGKGLSSNVFIIPSNSRIVIRGELVNTAAQSSQESFALFAGQCNREDIGRSKGVEETAHDAGSLSYGDTAITVGLRWNDTSGSFDQATTWTPQKGDLCVVCTTDDTAGDPSRPVPSFTHHRRVISVSGSTVVIDKGVGGGGNYMIIPTSRDLGYDRSAYGGVGRMETVENVVVRGNVTSQNGFPILTGGFIDGEVTGVFNGRSVFFGNGFRRSKADVSGWFSRGACEVAIGSEDYELDIIASHLDTGETYTTACFQIGERANGGRIKRARVSAPLWDGNDSFAVYGSDNLAEDVVIDTASVNRLAVIGSSTTPSDRFKSEILDIGSTGSMTGRLMESVNSSDLHISARLRGATSNADAVRLQDSGIVGKLRVVDDSGAVRINGEYLIGDIDSLGAISTSGTRITSDRVKPKLQSGYLASESFASPFSPTQDFQMTLTANLEIDDPAGTYEAGDRITMILAQDGTGGHTLTFAAGSLYRGVASPGSGTSSERWAATFEWTGFVWAQVSGNGGWN